MHLAQHPPRCQVVVMSKFIENLDRLREQAGGMTQNDLETAVGLPRGRIAKWRSKGDPTAKNLLRLAKYFDVSVDWLLGMVDGDPRNGRPDDEEMAQIRMMRQLKLSPEEVTEALAWAWAQKQARLASNGGPHTNHR